MKIDQARRRDLAGEIGKAKLFENPAQEAFLNLVRTHEVLVSEFERLFKEHGLSDPQYNAMLFADRFEVKAGNTFYIESVQLD